MKTNSKPEGQNIGRKLPTDAEAERAVLGCILMDNRHLDAVVGKLTNEDFFEIAHRRIFENMVLLSDEREPIDLLTMCERLRVSGDLEACGGPSYVSALIDGIPKVANVVSYARIVKEKSTRRAVIHFAHALQEQGFSTPDGGSAGLLESASRGLSEISRVSSFFETRVSYNKAAHEFMSRIDGGSLTRIFTGIEKVDACTGGFLPGELIVLTAETGTGKTLLASQIRRRACKRNLHSLFANGEMLAWHLAGREVANEAGVKYSRTRQPEHLAHHETMNLHHAVLSQCQRCSILDGELTLGRIKAEARAQHSDGACSLLVVDYDELVTSPGKDEFEQQRSLVQALKSIALELSISVLLISQLRKPMQSEDRVKPTLSRLYGNASKVKTASIVIYVDRPYVRELKGSETEARIAIIKNRDGAVGSFECTFDVQRLEFRDVIG